MSDKKKSYKRYGARYKARRRAVDLIYEAEMRDQDPIALVEQRQELGKDPRGDIPPVSDYTVTLVSGTARRLDEIDEMIARYLSDEWELHRLPRVDRAILRVMAWEILYQDDVDAPISVVDGVEMASQYAAGPAAGYIHVVLDAIAQSGSADSPLFTETDEDDDYIEFVDEDEMDLEEESENPWSTAPGE